MLRQRFDEKASRRANMYRNAYTRFKEDELAEDDDIDEGDEGADEGSDTVTLEVPADKAEAIKQLLGMDDAEGDEEFEDEGEEEEIEEEEEMSESLKASIARIRAKRVAEARRKAIAARRERINESRKQRPARPSARR